MDKPIPVVPDVGTAKAAQLAAEITGNPGRWVRLDCQHIRHVQQPVEDEQLLECPTCPPSTTGALAHRRVLGELPDHRLIALPAGEPVASSAARRLAAQALAPDMPKVSSASSNKSSLNWSPTSSATPKLHAADRG